MSTIVRTTSAKVGSLSVSKSSATTVSAVPQLDAVASKAQPGSLTTRTDTTDGEMTATNSSHGIGSGDLVDLFWSGGSRRGVLVGTVDGTAIPFSGGDGNDLPVASTAINVAKVIVFDETFDGDDVKAIVIKSNQEVVADFRTASVSAKLAEASPGDDFFWFVGDSTNELAGDEVTTIRCSNKSITRDATIKIAIAKYTVS